jgi:hypothetical protein
MDKLMESQTYVIGRSLRTDFSRESFFVSQHLAQFADFFINPPNQIVKEGILLFSLARKKVGPPPVHNPFEELHILDFKARAGFKAFALRNKRISPIEIFADQFHK